MPIPLQSNYAAILENNTILHMPTCLVVEMMMRLYSKVSLCNMSGARRNIAAATLGLLRRLTHNVNETVRAYAESRIRNFLGDWAVDRKRARKVFFNLLSRLGYICELVEPDDRRLLFGAVEDMNAAWLRLDSVMEEQGRERACGKNACVVNRHFRSEHPLIWKEMMASTLLELNAADDGSEPGTVLVLLCYRRIRSNLLRTVEELEKRNGFAIGLDADRVLCLSNEDMTISCPKCVMMTDSLRSGTTEVIHKGYRRVNSSRYHRRQTERVRAGDGGSALADGMRRGSM